MNDRIVQAPPRALALGLMILAPVLWSTAAVATRHMQAATPFELVFWRSLFAFAFVFIALSFARRNPAVAVRQAGWPGLFSGVLWAVMFTAFMLALTFTSTANTLVVMSVGPLLTALFARVMLKDPLPGRTWAAILVSTAGLLWMFGTGFAAQGARDIAGMAIALMVPFAAAANVVALRATHARLDLVPSVMLGGALSALIALPLAWPFAATPRDIAVLALLGVFQLGLPCMLLVLASRTLLAPEIALLGLLEVVLGVLWTWLFAGEVPGTATLAGGAVVLGALIFNEIAGFRRILAGKLSATRISG